LQSTLSGLCRGLFHLQFLGLSLSGGQSEEEAMQNLSAINALDTVKPWTLSFSLCIAGNCPQDMVRKGVCGCCTKSSSCEQRQTLRPLWGSIMALEIRKQLPPRRRVFMSKTATIRV
jgi:hypothetical protein